jgi:hypothetical protein
MNNLLNDVGELDGKTIKSAEIKDCRIEITTTDNCVIIIYPTTYRDRCGDIELDIETCYLSDLDYYEKERFGLLTEDDIEKHEIYLEKRRQKEESEKILKQEVKKRKDDETRLSELKLLAELKIKYE